MYPESAVERLGPRRASAGVGSAATRGVDAAGLDDDRAPTAGAR
ncbi:hypothetical protein ABNG03_01110 [Halorubrum sp. RMP-47]|uniref:Uncharacterized protein n=1 Tax=Halorubrum miltondacostae TaxID=3076378 RepID=A0ABD5LYI9_9EURY